MYLCNVKCAYIKFWDLFLNVYFSVEKTSYIAELKKSINIQDETINEFKATIQNVRIP